MKPTLRRHTHRGLIMLLLLVTASFPSRAALRIEVPAKEQVKPAGPGDSIVITKKMLKRQHRFDLYPDASNHVVFFNARGMQGKVYQLYVFNIEGQVVKQTEIRNNQTTLIKDIEKGVYLFEVFSDDDKIGNGQIAVM